MVFIMSISMAFAVFMFMFILMILTIRRFSWLCDNFTDYRTTSTTYTSTNHRTCATTAYFTPNCGASRATCRTTYDSTSLTFTFSGHSATHATTDSATNYLTRAATNHTTKHGTSCCAQASAYCGFSVAIFSHCLTRN